MPDWQRDSVTSSQCNDASCMLLIEDVGHPCGCVMKQAICPVISITFKADLYLRDRKN